MAPGKKDKGKGTSSSQGGEDRFDRMADIMERMMDRLDRQVEVGIRASPVRLGPVRIGPHLYGPGRVGPRLKWA